MGLSYAVCGGSPTVAPARSGPEGETGVFFLFSTVHGADAVLAKVNKDSAEWVEVPETGAWFGYLKANRPVPSDLLREETLEGYNVRLADGNEWVIPIARYVLSNDDSSPLPKSMRYNGGKWEPGNVLPMYQKFFEDACKVWDVISDEKTAGKFDVSTECDLSATAIGFNYRISATEISALGLIDTRNQLAIVKAIVDWPMLEEAKKKLDTEDSNSAPGNSDS